IQIAENAPLVEALKDVPQPERVLAAKLDGRLVPLAFVPERDGRLEWVTYADREGREVYRRTLQFILAMAVRELYANSRLAIGHSLGSGIYYDLFLDTPVNGEILGQIRRRMTEIVARNTPFVRRLVPRAEAAAFFTARAASDKVRLLENSDLDEVSIYENSGWAEIGSHPLAPATGAITRFELKSYSPGFLLLFPSAQDFTVPTTIGLTAKLFHVYQESQAWGKIQGVANVGRLNELNRGGGMSELIKVGECLHEKKIADLADAIAARRGQVRLVMIAGPSSSGKTTLAKRLAIHLRVNGVRPVMISMDNYFCDRDQCPRDEAGNFDFESLEALDVALFNRQLETLLTGGEVTLPRFDFISGKREMNWRPLHLEDDQLMIVEGIHGLNDQLSAQIPGPSKFLIYISALTQLTLDDHNRISTTDTRMVRRLVRDHKYRGYSAAETLRRFPSVMRGEEKHIFPFQERADAMFNSALFFELAILKPLAEPLLAEISPTDPVFSEAQRLLGFLRLFLPAASDELPPTSILREFVGGSSFPYGREK
ncbi:MAG TPA: nucleoside kinase, partial [Candidatus Aminicenantes bacterium]|nr:nucleoside kinase [Candidatus Aminicenantes bacterium]